MKTDFVWPHTLGFMTQSGAGGQHLSNLKSAILFFLTYAYILPTIDKKALMPTPRG